MCMIYQLPGMKRQAMNKSGGTTEDNLQNLKPAQTVLREGLGHMRLPFAYKLHILLEDMEKAGCAHIISWVEDGKAFKIHKPSEFTKKIQPQYFRQSKFASFVRHCYVYGFAKIEEGQCQGSYVHPQFVKWDQAKALKIQRQSYCSSRKAKGQISFSKLSQGASAGLRFSNYDSSRFRQRDSDREREPDAIISSELRPLAREAKLHRMNEAINYAINPPVNPDPSFAPRLSAARKSDCSWYLVLERQFLHDSKFDDNEDPRTGLEPRPLETMMQSPSYLSHCYSR